MLFAQTSVTMATVKNVLFGWKKMQKKMDVTEWLVIVDTNVTSSDRSTLYLCFDVRFNKTVTKLHLGISPWKRSTSPLPKYFDETETTHSQTLVRTAQNLCPTLIFSPCFIVSLSSKYPYTISCPTCLNVDSSHWSILRNENGLIMHY